MATDQTRVARSPYDNIATEVISGQITAEPHNTNRANLKIAVQGHVHGLNTMVGWDSMKADFRPVDTGDETNRWRMVSGLKTIAATSGAGSATVTFATDSDQGDPEFTDSPRFVATACGGSGVGEWMCDYPYSGPLPTLIGIVVHQLNGGTSSGNVNVFWIAYGKVA